MAFRTPTTLWLYVLADFWKLVFLTTGVLVTVLAFGLSIKPLADGKIDVLTTVRFMLIAAVPMLQYALPFAACFAATMSYHRLAADNELNACYAGGVSHRSLLVPALLSGIILSCTLLFLSNWAIPRSFRLMEEIITKEASRVIVNAIERGEGVEFNGTLVYADKVVKQGPDPASNAYERLWLGGVLIVKLDPNGTVESQGSAKSAFVWLVRTSRASSTKTANGSATDESSQGDEAVTRVIVKPNEFVATGAAFKVSGGETVLSFDVPNALRDNPKFLTFDELRALRVNPERMSFVDQPRRALAMHLAEREVIEAVRTSLRESGSVEFRDPFQQRVTLKASALRATRKADGTPEPRVYLLLPPAPDQPIVVERTSAEGKVQRQNAASAYLRLASQPDTTRGRVNLTLQLREVVAEVLTGEGEATAPPDVVAAGKGELKERPLADLSLAGDVSGALLTRPINDLVRSARERAATGRPNDAATLTTPVRTLELRVADLLRQVLSKEQERYAICVACLVMVVIGAVIAMRLRDALPLTIYIWAFFPALFTILAISGGQQLTHGQGVVGLPVLWSGVFVLGAYTLFEYGRLVRH